MEIMLAANDLELVKDFSKVKRMWRMMGMNKKGQLARIEIQLKKMKRKLALLAAATGAVSPEQVAEAKRVSTSNKVRIKEKKSKEAVSKKIWDV